MYYYVHQVGDQCDDIALFQTKGARCAIDSDMVFTPGSVVVNYTIVITLPAEAQPMVRLCCVSVCIRRVHVVRDPWQHHNSNAVETAGGKLNASCSVVLHDSGSVSYLIGQKSSEKR